MNSRQVQFLNFPKSFNNANYEKSPNQNKFLNWPKTLKWENYIVDKSAYSKKKSK